MIVYTKNNCPGCDNLKNWLVGEGIKFEQRNIDVNEKFKEEHDKLGFMGAPITVVNGKSINGFNPYAILQALEA